jgi:hypothetical protein
LLLEDELSVAWYIVLEREIPGFDPFVNGKALATAGKRLDSLATKKGVPTLMSFFSAPPEDLAGFAEDHGVLLKQAPSPEKWFSAEEGLETVKSIIEEGENSRFDARTIADLREFQKVLEIAKQHAVGWHLAVDF